MFIGDRLTLSCSHLFTFSVTCGTPAVPPNGIIVPTPVLLKVLKQFSCVEMFFTAYYLAIITLFPLAQLKDSGYQTLATIVQPPVCQVYFFL